jgi:hypothetical protein
MVGGIKKKKINSKLIACIVLPIVAICLLVGILMLVKYTKVEEAFILATSVKPETFTELYFENHLSLPNEITLSKKNNFKFIIHNLENKDMEYTYEVYLDVNGEKKIIYINSVFIKNTEYKTISADFAITTQIQKAKVVVNLINKNQQISFWIEEK